MKNADSQELLLELRVIIAKNKIPKKLIADKLNISPSALTSRFNQKNISIDALLELCKAIGVDMNIDFSPKGTE